MRCMRPTFPHIRRPKRHGRVRGANPRNFRFPGACERTRENVAVEFDKPANFRVCRPKRPSADAPQVGAVYDSYTFLPAMNSAFTFPVRRRPSNGVAFPLLQKSRVSTVHSSSGSTIVMSAS